MLFLVKKNHYVYAGKLTHLCQKLCFVVYPVMEENLEPGQQSYRRKADY